MIKGLRLPMTNKERASKRALRRNASDRAGNTTPTKSATGRNPRYGSTRNKYSLLEQQDREERRNLEIHKDMFQGTDGPRSLGMSAATLEAQNRARSGSAGKIERAKLRMTRVDGFNSTVGSNLPKRGTENLRLADRAFIPTSEVIDTLETLAGTLIFNTATREERLALASRLRRWVVEDGTYLIREGDGDRNQSAIFMIASGRATISLNRKLENGLIQEADIKDIRYPNYFGEGRVLGDSKAYASVRAKEELVVYYLIRADIEELLSPTTRALMVRDMRIRKFQKEHLDDLFGVIRNNPSGMACLTRFAKEQLMGGDVAFTTDIEAYKSTEMSDSERRKRAERIVGTYISPAPGGPDLIYTSQAQRKALGARMKRLWGKQSWKEEDGGQGKQGTSPNDGTGAPQDNPGSVKSPTTCDGNAGVDGDRLVADGSGICLGDGRGEGSEDAKLEEFGPMGVESANGSDVRCDSGSMAPSDLLENQAGQEKRDRLGSDESEWSVQYHDTEYGQDAGDLQQEADRALSLSLFDDILNQNAIPTTRQNIVPKFIQSSYYEIFLAELFPQVADAGAENGDDAGGGDVREQGLSDSIEDIRHDPEAVAERIAVAVAAAAARSEGRKEREDAANNEATPDWQPTPGGGAHPLRMTQRSSNGGGENLSCMDVVGEVASAEGSEGFGAYNVDDNVFSDELLVVASFRQEGVASRLSAGIQAASDVCVVM